MGRSLYDELIFPHIVKGLVCVSLALEEVAEREGREVMSTNLWDAAGQQGWLEQPVLMAGWSGCCSGLFNIAGPLLCVWGAIQQHGLFFLVLIWC